MLFFHNEEVKAISQGQASSASHLFTWVLWMFLEGPGDSGLEGLGDALQESAAAFHSIQLPLCHTVLMVVCRGQQSKRQEVETQSGLSGTGWKNEKGQEKTEEGNKNKERKEGGQRATCNCSPHTHTLNFKLACSLVSKFIVILRKICNHSSLQESD